METIFDKILGHSVEKRSLARSISQMPLRADNMDPRLRDSRPEAA